MLNELIPATLSPIPLYRGSAFFMNIEKPIGYMPVRSHRASLPPHTTYRGHNMVYASPYFWYAATYGLKQSVKESMVVFCPIRNENFYFSRIVMSAKEFNKIKFNYTYITKVPYKNFSPMPNSNKDTFHFHEYISRPFVKILGAGTLLNDDLLRNGVQVFTTDDQTLHKISNPQNLPKADKTVQRWNPKKFAALILNGDVNWENARPEYDDAPRAIPPQVLRYFGLKEIIRPKI